MELKNSETLVCKWTQFFGNDLGKKMEADMTRYLNRNLSGLITLIISTGFYSGWRFIFNLISHFPSKTIDWTCDRPRCLLKHIGDQLR